MMFRMFLALALSLALPAAAQQSDAYPRGKVVIIQLTSSQMVSGFGEYLVPPLLEALEGTGLVYAFDAEPDYAASIATDSDVGRWVETEDSRDWIYTRSVTVGLSPADVDIEPGGKPSPSFSVKTILQTPDQDRVDELNCLISLATRELAARYAPKGHFTVNGQGCLRK